MAEGRRWTGRARELLDRTRLLPAGVAFGALLACLSMTPSLLPRAPLFQGIVTGAALACGYGIGVFAAWCWRGLLGRERQPWPSWARWLLVGGGATIGLTSLLLGARWQEEAHRLADTESTPVAYVLLTPPVALVVAAAMIGLARGARVATRRVIRLLERRLQPSAARVVGVLLVGLVAWTVVSDGVGDAVLRSLDATFAVRDKSTPAGVTRPTSDLRSGSDVSLVEWDDLGREGRAFVGGGPTAAEIAALTQRPASEPIRSYAGLDSAAAVEDRAALAVEDLDRAGGFERAHLLVVTTTGTGWVEPSAASGFEYVTGGDSAIVGMQYSHLASWLSFLVDAERARDAGRALFDAVYGHWRTLPSEQRPELYVFGESLGSFGAETAFSGEFDLANRTSGALFVGPPSFNPLYGEFVDDRDATSREIEPVFNDGRIVRFTTDADADHPDPAGRPWTGPRVLYLQHASDPVTWWSPDLVYSRPDWLEEEPGTDVPGSMIWIPVVSFLQVSADLAAAFSTQPAHGHNFSGEHAAAWVTIVQPEGWTRELTQRLRLELRRFP